MVDQYISHLSFHLSIINTYVIQNYILRITSRINLHRYPSQLFAFMYGKGERKTLFLDHDTEFLNIFIDEKPRRSTCAYTQSQEYPCKLSYKQIYIFHEKSNFNENHCFVQRVIIIIPETIFNQKSILSLIPCTKLSN